MITSKVNTLVLDLIAEILRAAIDSLDATPREIQYQGKQDVLISGRLRRGLAAPLLCGMLVSSGCSDPQYGTISRPKDAPGTDGAFDKVLGSPELKGAAKKRQEKAEKEAPKAVNPKLSGPNG